MNSSYFSTAPALWSHECQTQSHSQVFLCPHPNFQPQFGIFCAGTRADGTAAVEHAAWGHHKLHLFGLGFV